MADTTANLEMPFILPSQAQKHVTHNEALLRLDALVHLAVVDELPEPPASSENGACYLVTAEPAGAWAGFARHMAIWQDGAWNFAKPKNGWRAWFVAAARLRVLAGSGWQDIPLPAIGSLAQIGINATPDATNRLSLASPASLFDHAGNGHQVKVNKSAAADTASLVFQAGYTGYAEMGLAGDNRFSIKVSDGSTWKTGLSISPAGCVTRPNQPAACLYRSGPNFSPAGGEQSGFTTFATNQGGFSLGASVAGGGNSVLIPATGLYLVAITMAAAATSPSYTVRLALNAEQPLVFVSGISGGPQIQSNFGIFFLNSGDSLTLIHAETAQFEAGRGKTQLSIAML